LGEVLNDDESHAKKSMWKIRANSLVLEGANTGMLGQCQSTGTMALLKPSSPFFTDNVHAEFDILVNSPTSVADVIGVGFVFRYRSPVDFYRFEWQNDCMSVVHYLGAKKKRVATILAQRNDALITFDRWYHVTVDMNAGAVNVVVRSTRLRGANSVKENAEWKDENYNLAVTNDAEYTPLLSFIGGFYGVATTSMRVDNVIMVALDQRDYLGSWDDVAYPNGTYCSTLPDTACFFENFEHKYIDEIANGVYIDGPLTDVPNVDWTLLRNADITYDNGMVNRHVLTETTGYAAAVESGNRSPCQRLYGTYFMLNDTDKIEAEELIVSFMMKAIDKHTRGIGIMLRLQNALPGFRPTPSYYRYSWGETGTGEVCDSLLYHNGVRGRFEDVMSEAADIAAPEALRVNVWHRIEVHVSRDRIEVTRDGELVGQPILKPNGAPSLRLTWGGIALYCGGRDGGLGTNVCAFDDVLVVGKEYARQAVVWDTKTPVPEYRPLSTVQLVVTGDLAPTRWEGVRVWSMYYTRTLEAVCASKGETFEQPVAVEFLANGHFRVYAREVKLSPAKDGSERFLLAENRDAFLVEDYDTKQSQLKYKHYESDEVHCMTFKLNDNEQFAFMGWSKEDRQCEPAPNKCGFTAELTRLGEASAQYPPTLTVTDPLPGHNEQWTVGSNQTITLHVYNAHNLRAQVYVQLLSKEREGMVKLNRLAEFTHEAGDQWITGEAKLQTTLPIDQYFTLGRSVIQFQLKHALQAPAVGVDVEIVCPVCQNGTAGMDASTCAYWCKDPTGCPEPKCEIGRIRCTKRFTGHNVDGLCTKWSKDRPPVCRPAGGCTHLDEYNFCDWSGNKKKPVTTAKCGSPACRKNCEAGTEAPPWSFYETGDITLVCETNRSTSVCKPPSQCRADGSCLTHELPPPTSAAPALVPTPAPTPFPPPPPLPLEEPVLPVCRQCVNDFGEPGSPQWCVCCKYDCNKARDACMSINGFCRSRCVDDEGTFCPTVMPAPAPEVVFAPVSTLPLLPPDNDHPVEAPRPAAVAHDDDGDSDSDSDGDGDSEESKSSKSSHHHHQPAKAPKTPETTRATAATTTTTAAVAVTTTTTVAVHLADSGSPANDLLHANATLAVGAVLFVGLIVVVVLYRKRTQQKPIDMGHVA
jgi:hypothetical protein